MRIFNTEFNIDDVLTLEPSGARSILSLRRLTNAARVIASERKHSCTVAGLPFAINVEPSAVCDMKCPICALTVSPPRTPPFLNWDIYKSIIGEFGSMAIFLNLWTWGEPLLNPRIGEMISLAKKNRILTAIHTNGKNLSGPIAEHLIRDCLCYIVVSFDGATKESYGAIRGAENFVIVRENVAEFMRLRKTLRSELPLVELKMIVTRYNQNEIHHFAELGKLLGVDRITYRRLVLAHTPKTAEMVPEYKEYRPIDASAHGYARSLYCNRPWRSSVILASGDVVPCCDDSRFEHIMGNISDPGGFAAIWNNEKYRAFRHKLINDPTSIQICSKCPENSFREDIFIKPENQ